MPPPILMLITNPATASLPISEVAARAIAGGVDLVQIRAKSLSRDDLAALVESVLEATNAPMKLIVNGSPELAARYSLGLHLPESFDWPEVRPFSLRLLSRSVHTAAEARRSIGADLLVAGHVFPTASKSGAAPLGLNGLVKIIAEAPCPTMAIGGIDLENAPRILEAGAAGVAVMSAINDSPDPEKAALGLRRVLGS